MKRYRLGQTLDVEIDGKKAKLRIEVQVPRKVTKTMPYNHVQLNELVDNVPVAAHSFTYIPQPGETVKTNGHTYKF